MSFLRDVRRHHVYHNHEKTLSSEHLLHPFTNSTGEHKGKYEILRTQEIGEKISAHVTFFQLAELCAHDCFIQFNIRLRMKDPTGSYPTSPPGIHPQHDNIIRGSDFDKAVAKIDIRMPVSLDLKRILTGIGINLV